MRIDTRPSIQPTLFGKPTAPKTKVFTNGTPGSDAGATAIAPHAGTQEARVLDLIVGCGALGATREEIELSLKMKIQSVCGRVGSLLEKKLVVEKGMRETSTGVQASIVVASKFVG